MPVRFHRKSTIRTFIYKTSPGLILNDSQKLVRIVERVTES